MWGWLSIQVLLSFKRKIKKKYKSQHFSSISGFSRMVLDWSGFGVLAQWISVRTLVAIWIWLVDLLSYCCCRWISSPIPKFRLLFSVVLLIGMFFIKLFSDPFMIWNYCCSLAHLWKNGYESHMLVLSCVCFIWLKVFDKQYAKNSFCDRKIYFICSLIQIP